MDNMSEMEWQVIVGMAVLMSRAHPYKTLPEVTEIVKALLTKEGK